MNRSQLKTHNSQRGFTLIELLVVIAVIGVLAGAIIVAINPVEQLKRSRDTARKSATGQLASAVSAYYVSKGGTYPTANATWVSTLVTAGELKAAPATVTITAGGTSCASNNQSNYCYVMSGNDFLVFTELEAVADSSKCPSPPVPQVIRVIIVM
ncbi:MAG: type II secretion system protein [Candidatus Levybacteria bacterium]|nr:type II secretion system protein [Candidatus Levybacteria bacterium]